MALFCRCIFVFSYLFFLYFVLWFRVLCFVSPLLFMCDMEEFGRLKSEKMIAILLIGDRWWPQTAKQDGDRTSK